MGDLLERYENLLARNCHLPDKIEDFAGAFRRGVRRCHYAAEPGFKGARAFASGIDLARAFLAVEDERIGRVLNLVYYLPDFLDAVDYVVGKPPYFRRDDVKVLSRLAGAGSLKLRVERDYLRLVGDIVDYRNDVPHSVYLLVQLLYFLDGEQVRVLDFDKFLHVLLQRLASDDDGIARFFRKPGDMFDFVSNVVRKLRRVVHRRDNLLYGGALVAARARALFRRLRKLLRLLKERPADALLPFLYAPDYERIRDEADEHVERRPYHEIHDEPVERALAAVLEEVYRNRHHVHDRKVYARDDCDVQVLRQVLVHRHADFLHASRHENALYKEDIDCVAEEADAD